MNLNKWKRATLLLLTAAWLLATPALANSTATVVVNGSELQTDSPAVLKNGTTYVPLRAFADAVAPSTVTWNAPASTARVSSPGLNVEVQAGRQYMTANDRAYYMADSVLMQSGRVLVPVRALSFAYGLNVSWDNASRTAYIDGSVSPVQNGTSFYNSDSLFWLSRIIHAESQGESMKGKLAVGNVILNRVRSSTFPNSIYSVIFDRNYGVQFTPTENGTIHQTPGADSVAAAKMVLEGVKAVPDGTLYFQNPATAVSQWIPQNRPYVTTIGAHKFYR